MPSPAGGGGEESGEDHAQEVRLDSDLGMPDIAKETTTEERQTTYRSNGLIWMRSYPYPRLWVMRASVAVQQSAQSELFMQAGESWEHREMQRRQQGAHPRYRIVEAASGRYSTDVLVKYGKCMTQSDEWLGIPSGFRHHDLACAAYRSLAAGAAATFILIHCLTLRDNFSNFLLLTRAPPFQRVLAQKILRRQEQFPCIVSPWWYEHCKRYSTVDALLGPDSMAKITAQAEFA